MKVKIKCPMSLSKGRSRCSFISECIFTDKEVGAADDGLCVIKAELVEKKHDTKEWVAGAKEATEVWKRKFVEDLEAHLDWARSNHKDYVPIEQIENLIKKHRAKK